MWSCRFHFGVQAMGLSTLTLHLAEDAKRQVSVTFVAPHSDSSKLRLKQTELPQSMCKNLTSSCMKLSSDWSPVVFAIFKRRGSAVTVLYVCLFKSEKLWCFWRILRLLQPECDAQVEVLVSDIVDCTVAIREYFRNLMSADIWDINKSSECWNTFQSNCVLIYSGALLQPDQVKS